VTPLLIEVDAVNAAELADGTIVVGSTYGPVRLHPQLACSSLGVPDTSGSTELQLVAEPIAATVANRMSAVERIRCPAASPIVPPHEPDRTGK
jgi:hypothetical protein